IDGVFEPFTGPLTDQTGKTKRYLVRTTLITIVFFSLLSFVQQPFALILFFLLACFFYHSSLVFYNSLLTVAARPEEQGFASGLGTGLGYLGVVVTLPLAHLIDQTFGRSHVFWTTALLFLLFSLPLFFYVPERAVSQPIRFQPGLWTCEWKKISETFRNLPEYPHLLLFLGGNFFVVDALNSTIFWIAVYCREVFHPAQSHLILFLMALNVTAFLAGILNGILTDRWGAMKTLLLASGSLAATLTILIPLSDFTSFAFVSLVGGAFALAGIWTAARKVVIEWSPKEKLGESFGLYGLTTKVSVIGSLAFSIVADWAGFKQALWVLVFPATAGFLFLSWAMVMSQKCRSGSHLSAEAL
ncbi:MAG: MFS transporter, partial [Candidatus Omnitrophica bacterium]|nr:MFS transporter [Candidatus Omnitrophota bacterium]